MAVLLASAACETVALRPAGEAAETPGTAEVAEGPEPVADPAGEGPRATALSVGPRSSCAILDDDSLWCWGSGGGGMLGQSPGPGPVRIETTPELSAVSVGPDRVCLVSAGIPQCFGRLVPPSPYGADFFQTPPAPEEAPQPVRGLTGVSALAVGVDQSCFGTGGAVRCLGNEERGGGRNAYGSRVGDEMVADARSITAGAVHTCAARADGSVACWGTGRAGQFAGARVTWFTYEAKAVPDLSRVRQVASAPNGALTCALDEADAIACWGTAGDFRDGEGMALGEGLIPLAAAGEPLARIAVGLLEVFAVAESGALYRYAVGAPTGAAGSESEERTVRFGSPQRLATPPVSDVGVGLSHTCALGRSGEVYCWGLPLGGRLGVTATAATPVVASDPVRVRFESRENDS